MVCIFIQVFVCVCIRVYIYLCVCVYILRTNVSFVELLRFFYFIIRITGGDSVQEVFVVMCGYLYRASRY